MGDRYRDVVDCEHRSGGRHPTDASHILLPNGTLVASFDPAFVAAACRHAIAMHLKAVRQEWEPLVGRKVIFTYFHGEQQEGVVTSCNDKYVFVRFGKGDTSESCNPSQLTLVTAGRL